MNKIKMSDVFNLPINPWAVTRMWDEDIKLAVIAINAYDANQAEIAHWKSNHDNVVKKLREFTARPDLKINKQQERIAELETMLQEVIYHFESGNGDHSGLNDGMVPKLKELAIKGGNNETT